MEDCHTVTHGFVNDLFRSQLISFYGFPASGEGHARATHGHGGGHFVAVGSTATGADHGVGVGGSSAGEGDCSGRCHGGCAGVLSIGVEAAQTDLGVSSRSPGSRVQVNRSAGIDGGIAGERSGEVGSTDSETGVGVGSRSAVELDATRGGGDTGVTGDGSIRSFVSTGESSTRTNLGEGRSSGSPGEGNRGSTDAGPREALGAIGSRSAETDHRVVVAVAAASKDDISAGGHGGGDCVVAGEGTVGNEASAANLGVGLRSSRDSTHGHPAGGGGDDGVGADRTAATIYGVRVDAAAGTDLGVGGSTASDLHRNAVAANGGIAILVPILSGTTETDLNEGVGSASSVESDGTTADGLSIEGIHIDEDAAGEDAILDLPSATLANLPEVGIQSCVVEVVFVNQLRLPEQF